MQSVGKIIEFDGYHGTLIDENNNEHIFSKDDLITKEVNIHDIVSFESEIFKTVDIELHIARFVRTIKKA